MPVRNLGFRLDNVLGVEKQVNSICKSFYYQIRNIGLIRKYINDETWKTLVQALVDWTVAMPCYIISPSFWQTASPELCCTFGDTNSQRGHIT